MTSPSGTRPVDPRSVPTKPGSLGFTIGRGSGQWALLVAVLGIVGASLWQGARLGALVLVGVLTVCAVVRAVLPARWVPALVNRGRAFDVTVHAVLAVLVAGLVVSGTRL